LLPHQSENVLPIKRTLNRLENDLSRPAESTLAHAKHHETGAARLESTQPKRGCEDEYEHG
jgi:hypothetical protein